jgi:class 3 adenylate cyclase
MPLEGFKRKLTAILSADAAGYSRLMRKDESATVRDITAHRALISEIIQQHHGQAIDSPGDNILAEFASVVDTVNGAIEILAAIQKSNTDIPDERCMEIRIGINLGDVIKNDGRIFMETASTSPHGWKDRLQPEESPYQVQSMST